MRLPKGFKLPKHLEDAIKDVFEFTLLASEQCMRAEEQKEVNKYD